MSEEKIFAFIFHPGFSTKDKITTMSGRGVGMDVVQNIVNKYHGRVEVQSKKGEGTKILLRVPVPKKLLVERCLLGKWKDFVYAFPVAEVAHICSCDELQVTLVDQMRFCQFEKKTVPLLSLDEIYNRKPMLDKDQVKDRSVVFMKTQEFILGILVDRIDHQADLVIKPFGTLFKKIPGIKGNSVLSDDQLVYVVDVSELSSLWSKEKSWES